MGNSAQADNNSSRDMGAFLLMASYCDASSNVIAGAIPYVASCVINCGEQPSQAFAPWPARGLLTDEVAPNVALQSDGPAGVVLPRSRAMITYVAPGGKTQQVMNGTVAEIIHDIGDDSATATIFGDIFLLGKCVIFGRVVYDPSTSQYYFDGDMPCTFNLDGWPDCIDSPLGPCFVPSRRWGWPTDFSGEDYVESDPGSSPTRSRTWTAADAALYCRNWCDPAFPVTPPSSWWGNHGLSQWIKWPKTASAVFNTVIASATPNGISSNMGSRPMRNIDIQGLTMDRALTIICRRAGAFNVYFTPNGDFTSTLSFVSMCPGTNSANGNTPTTIYIPGFSSNLDDYMGNPMVAQRGWTKESLANYYDEVSLLGDTPVCEKTASMASAGFSGTATQKIGQGLLQPGWSNPVTTPGGKDDQTLFNAYVSANGNTEEAFNVAAKRWPYVYCAYKTKGDWFAGTKWAQGAWPIGQTGSYAHIRPMLLSGSNQGSNNPRDWAPRDIVVEVANVAPFASNVTVPPSAAAKTQITFDPSSEFIPQIRQDGIELSPDGQFLLLPALRDLMLTWGNLGSGGDYQGNAMYAKCVRITLAAAGTMPILGRATDDPNGTAGRVAPVNPSDTWTYWAVSNPQESDYIDWTRLGSWPESTTITTQATDKATVGNELYSDIGDQMNPDPTKRAQIHSEKRLMDVKRVSNGGQVSMPWWSPSIVPGLPVTLGGLTNSIPNYNVVQSVTLNASENMVTVELGGPESQTIYDAPMLGGPTGNPATDVKINKNAPAMQAYAQGGSMLRRDAAERGNRSIGESINKQQGIRMNPNQKKRSEGGGAERVE